MAQPPVFSLPMPPAGWQQRPAGLSLCMIVRDEEKFLGDALESVKGLVDEICIVDTGSQDRTLELARNAGAKTREIAWEDDFAMARNASLEMATKRWIFVLDADERLSPRSRDFLRGFGANPAHLTGLMVRCYNFSEDYKGTGAMSNVIIRVFPNHERIRYRNRIHELIALDGAESGMPAVPSPVELIHFGYRPGVIEDRNKAERNLSLSEKALREDPESAFNWYNYGMSAILAKQPSLAKSALERMRELVIADIAKPGRRLAAFAPSGFTLLATIYLNDFRDPARAEGVARETLKLVPTFADAHFALGKALLAQRKSNQARDAFIAAIEDGKDVHRHPFVDNEVPLWKAQSEIGATLLDEGGFELALAWFDRALQVRPKVQPVRLNRARALERLGRLDEAEAAFAEVWRDDGDPVAADDYLNYLLRRGRNEDALQFIDANAERLPPEFRLIMYGSAAAIASRAGLPGMERYVELAEGIEGIDHHHARLHGLIKHFGETPVLELLERKMKA